MIGYGRLNVALPSLPGFYWVWPSRSTDWKIKKNNNNQIDDDLLAVSMDLHGRHLIFSLNLSLSLSLSASLVHGLARFTELSRCVQMSVSRPSIKWLRRPNIFLSTPIWPASPTRFIDSNEHPKSWASRSCLFFFFSRTKKKVHSSGHHQIQFADCRLDSGFRWANGSNPRPRFLLPWFISCPIGLVCGIKRSVCHGRWIL